jgi:CheY-like chemotaxis protein
MHFAIPIAVPDTSDVHHADAQESGEEAAKPLGSLLILVAEDNPVNQLVLCRTLEKLGHTTVVAWDGHEVLAMMRDKVFDLVLMDIQMPEMDGIEATRRIRAGEGPWNAEIPIVAVTAHAMKGDRERLLEQGMNEYLPKPVDIDNLHEVIQRLCQ